MITNRRLYIGLPVVAVALAVIVLAVLQWQSTRAVVEVGFWFDDVTFELSSPLDLQQLGGPIDDREKAMIRELAQHEMESAYADLRVRFTENRRAYHRVRVVQGELEGATKLSRGAAGQTVAMGPAGGDSTISFYVAVRGAFAYASSQATRRDILEGIGRGVGRTAVHELAHQFLGTTSAHSRDDRSYEYGSPDRIGQYYGPIHWSTAWEPLQERLGRCDRVRPHR
jgi:hypothetical protein